MLIFSSLDIFHKTILPMSTPVALDSFAYDASIHAHVHVSNAPSTSHETVAPSTGQIRLFNARP